MESAGAALGRFTVPDQTNAPVARYMLSLESVDAMTSATDTQ
jgi:hypothetical protein